ncbi:glycosyl transferase family 2 [Seonamhaeicola sp. S2-3]|uniref:glycosyltransferase n=1 Tax=Seonamhaeicola sp. S2-3 TaxID=1936081 RepID=UPI000972B8BA|nr:glycosyltransferase [Seonamhaeicola sp. S2-3]APY11001.1 glycosyl transferase family 2 [Seonamhaeicola sp. S2-3]
MSRIIVLIPHFNRLDELKKSLVSIEESQEIDVLIVDDGSKEKPDINEIKEFYKQGKVYLEVLEKNSGIENALNRGLEFIKGLEYKYIGRLDCGDYCVKDRFTKQMEYLDNKEDVYLLGSWANIKDSKGVKLHVLKHPVKYNDIKKKMYLNSMFVHPSVVFRTCLIDEIGFYPTNYKAAEDYAFFFKIIKKYKAENYPEALLDYIIEEDSISSQKRFLQVKSRIRIIMDNFKFGFYPIYGLARNVLLLFLSRNVTTYIKKIISKK